MQQVTLDMQAVRRTPWGMAPHGGDHTVWVLLSWILEMRRVSIPAPVPPQRGVGQLESLEAIAGLGLLADDVKHGVDPVSYKHLRAHETPEHLVCRLLLEKKKRKRKKENRKTYN
eukprot:TRINITY_DN6051_c0_g1_i3.p2 TRINITY_DN6051_c0_g1~~TRINITY_DN6051_c0_g1_i3.p2  ORF type:complete len:115 (-),score=6.70 TRINITY_DN6051_c0_g1_i3:56-400(-)